MGMMRAREEVVWVVVGCGLCMLCCVVLCEGILYIGMQEGWGWDSITNLRRFCARCTLLSRQQTAIMYGDGR